MGVGSPDVLVSIVGCGLGHLFGAPVGLNVLANADTARREGIEQKVQAMAAGAAPPAAVIPVMERMNLYVTHVYGLTETYGPSVVCAPQDQWEALPEQQRAELTARQGVRAPMLEELMVADPETMARVPQDGKTIG